MTATPEELFHDRVDADGDVDLELERQVAS
jgi:hypothetical protein